jgi:hypothetical protein
MAQRHTLSTRFDPETDTREWAITVENYSRPHDMIGHIALRICGLTGHRIEDWFTMPIVDWAFRKENRVLLVPISEDDAFLVDPKWVTRVKRHDREWDEDED